MVLRSYFCTAGPTKSTATSTLRLCKLRRATGAIVPYLRGYGTTRYFSGETFRNGQQSVIAVDVIALMDALGIERASLGGCDWGAWTADVIAALWPVRCKALVSVSGYLIGSPEANKGPLPQKAELQWWYQYYFATVLGSSRRSQDRENRR